MATAPVAVVTGATRAREPSRLRRMNHMARVSGVTAVEVSHAHTGRVVTADLLEPEQLAQLVDGVRRREPSQVHAMGLAPVLGKEHEVRVVVVDVLDLEIRVPFDVRPVPHERGHLRVVVQLSSRACPDLAAVHEILLAVADHRLLEYLTADVKATRCPGQQQQGGEKTRHPHAVAAASPCLW